MALCVCHWIWAIGHKYRVALHCSDVAGASDKVSNQKLVTDTTTLGLHGNTFKVIRSWLEHRIAHVIVDNKASRHFRLENMVSQGTVLGPPL